MSTRHMRKFYGTNALPPLEGNSDEEFEPLYAKKTKAKFADLVLSSHSDSDQEAAEEDNVDDIVESEEKTKKKKKKKKKKQRQSKPEPFTNNNEKKELDEIDKSLKEVNALLGSPPPASSFVPVEKKVDMKKVLLAVQAKHLDYHNELKKLFGSESLDDERGKRYKPHNVVKYRRGVIVPIADNRHFYSVGLSMSLHRRENDSRSYFTFDHNREYQQRHQQFLEAMTHEDVVPLDEKGMHTHIEGLLQSADYMFRAEEYTVANNILEQVISYMHYIAHPCFNLTNQSVRLEYKYAENRPFHIAVLKYCHMLTNKACHRTALELAKLLLNLDPSDPLAIIFVIDTIALRAREHQWLIDAVEYWKKERDAGYLFNLQYSYAMAHYHIAKKNKSNDYSRADELVKEAMLHYPTIAARLFENSKQECEKISDHPFFSLAGEDKFPEKIKTAMILHAKLVYWRWREPPVMKWFARNVNELIDQLDNDPDVKKRGEELSQQRYSLYRACPEQIHRHLHVVRPMANLLVEWELPQMTRQPSWDPLPPADGINRYEYGSASDSRYYSGLFNIFARFLGPEQLYPEEWYEQRRMPGVQIFRIQGGRQQARAQAEARAEARARAQGIEYVPGEIQDDDPFFAPNTSIRYGARIFCSTPDSFSSETPDTNDEDSDSSVSTFAAGVQAAFLRINPDDWDINFPSDLDLDEAHNNPAAENRANDPPIRTATCKADLELRPDSETAHVVPPYVAPSNATLPNTAPPNIALPNTAPLNTALPNTAPPNTFPTNTAPPNSGTSDSYSSEYE